MAQRKTNPLGTTALLIGASALVIGGAAYAISLPASASKPPPTGPKPLSPVKPKPSVWEGNWAGPIAVAGLGLAGVMSIIAFK